MYISAITLIIILSINSIDANAIIPYSIKFSSDEYYVLASIWIGTPARQYNLRLSSHLSSILLYSNDSFDSFSYSDTGKTDFITLQDSLIGIPVEKINRVDFNGYNDIAKMSCSDDVCDGFLGVGSGSFLWKLSKWVSITMGFIQLRDSPTSSVLSKHVHPIACFQCTYEYPDVNNDFLLGCKTISATYNGTDGVSYTIRFLLDTRRPVIPKDVYDDYFMGKNVYKSGIQDWKPMKLSLSGPSCKTTTESAKPNKIDIELSPDDLIEEDGFYTKRLRVIPSPSDAQEFLMGPGIMERHVIDICHSEGEIMLHRRPSFKNIDPLDLLLITLVATIFVHWEINRMTMNPFEEKELDIYYNKYGMTFNTVIVYSVFGYALFNGRSNSIINYEDRTRLELLILSWIVFMVLELSVIIYFLVMKRTKHIQNHASPLHEKRIKMMTIYSSRNMSFSYASLNCIWCFLIQRRVFGLTTFPSLVCLVYLSYICIYESVYLFSMLYSAKSGDHTKHIKYIGGIWVAPLSFTIFTVSLGYTLYYSYFVSFREWCLYSSQRFYKELWEEFSLITFTFIAYAALFLAVKKAKTQIGKKRD